MKVFTYKKTFLQCLFFLFLISYSTYAQVGIGNTNPNANSLLEIGDGTDTKGVLLPRVALTGTNNPAPLATDIAGMIIYNTATNGAGATAVTPGFYYNDGADWIRLAPGESDDWKTDGNVGTIPGTNFIGTTDAQALSFKTNNVERFWMSQNGQFRSASDGSAALPNFTWKDDTNTGLYRIGNDILGLTTGGTEKFRLGTTEAVINEDSNDYNFRVETDNDANTIFVDGANDNVGMGTNTPAADVKLEVNGGANNAIFGYSNNVGGYLGRETNISFGTPTQTALGAGVYANNPFAGYTSVYSQSTGAATVAASINYSDVWIASYNYVENNSSLSNPTALYSQLNNTGGVPAYRAGIFGTSSSGSTAVSGGIDVGIRAQSSAQNDNTLGVFATTFSNGSDISGGYFLAASYGGTLRSQAWVANYYSGTDYKVFGTGTVSTIVEGDSNKHIMYAPEAPEVLFQDFGIGKLVNGNTTITIDPIFAKNIVVDANHPLRVYVTLEGECNGIYVTSKSKTGFTVRELQNGNSNVSFSWQIVANRKDRKGDSEFGDSKFQDLRFPIFNKDHMPKVKKENMMVANDKK